MMKKTRLTIACLACLLVGMARAQEQNIESVELYDGSVLEGYISEQCPGKSMAFSACRATIIVPEKAVASITEQSVDYASLSPEWKRWADASSKGKQGITLSDISFANSWKTGADSAGTQGALPKYLRVSPHKVRVLEKGAMVKYLDLNPQTYQLDWKDVKYVRRSPRPALMLNGLNEVIRVKDNGAEHAGEIVEQVLGKQIRLLKKDGMIEVINSSQITSMRKEKLNPEQDMFAQAPLLDIVYTRSGNSLTGIIMEQNFVNAKERPAFLTVQTKDGDSRFIPYTDVEKYGRQVNKDYKPLTDVILDDTTKLINRKEVRYTPFEQDKEGFLYAKDQKGVVVLERDSLENGQDMHLEVKNLPGMTDLSLIRATEKRVVERKKETIKIGFTYENFALYSTRAARQAVSVNGTCKMTFAVNAPGWYVIYSPRARQGILCQVK